MTEQQASHEPSRNEFRRGCRCDACCDAKRAYEREYYIARNRDRKIAQVTAWREQNGDKARGYSAKQRLLGDAEYKARALVSSAAWRARNAVQVEANYKAYMQTPAGKLTNQLKSHRRRGSVSDEWTRPYAAIIRHDPCVYCGGKSTSVDHIIPVSKGGTSEWDNLAPSCKSCNSSKHTSDLLGFLGRRMGVPA